MRVTLIFTADHWKKAGCYLWCWRMQESHPQFHQSDKFKHKKESFFLLPIECHQARSCTQERHGQGTVSWCSCFSQGNASASSCPGSCLWCWTESCLCGWKVWVYSHFSFSRDWHIRVEGFVSDLFQLGKKTEIPAGQRVPTSLKG